MKIVAFVLVLFSFVGYSFSHVFAAHTTFTVTSFSNGRDFLWVGGPTSACSAINSYVMTYPDNNQQSKLFSCEETFGSSDDNIPDGKYYILLAVGGHAWMSQVFVIENGGFQPVPTTTPTPTATPTPINQSPIAIAGTSLDANNNVQLDASLSSDPENNPLTYVWRIDGKTWIREGKTVSVADIPAGTHNVVLTVSDGLQQAVDRSIIGLVTKRPLSTISMTIDKLSLHKKTGNFTIKGELDTSHPLFSRMPKTTTSRVLLELQTSEKTSTPIYGIVGEDTHPLSIIK